MYMIQIDTDFTLTAQRPIRMAKVGLCTATFSQENDEYVLLRESPCIYEQMK